MTIGGFAHRLKESLDKDNRLRNYTDIILIETARLERLVKQVHELARVQSASLSPDNMEKVINEVLVRFKPLTERQGVKLVTDIDQELPLIIMDSPQIVIALSNIIENAMESMSGKGTLELKVKLGNDSIMIMVSDTGSGIVQEELDSIYDPFVTSKTRGAGLGLTMVHQIIMNHHGEISIKSKAFKGTIVTIQLPIDPNQ